ncbi:protein phosphatase 5 [Schizophyllum commune Loenen D]|nr:protein phosphatase 5 [Schizophyllum commune Loenen D]
MSDSATTSSASTPPTSAPPSPELQTLSISDKIVTDEDKAEAAKLKAEANKAFAAHDFAKAVELYSSAIEKNPGDATIWCNRAYARMKLEEFGYALNDASARATCYLQTLRPQLAVADFKRVLQIEPRNETVRAQLTSTQKLIRKIEFEKAIEVEGEKSPVERCREIIAEGGCDVDKGYAGPKLRQDEDGKYTITLEFVRAMIEWFKDGKALPKRYVWEIVLAANDIFSKEDSLVTLDIPEDVTIDVIGDVHGQYYDLLHLYSLTGEPSEKHYLLMNGDLVDRGSWSIEVILTALSFKWLYPKYMFINRGNHEAKDMNRSYGFEGEAKTKHGEQSYKLFAHVFTTLPLATLICASKPPPSAGKAILSPDGKKRYFVVHGGLFSKDGVTLEDIRKLDRIGKQPGTEGLMCELLWTDPQAQPGRGPSKRNGVTGVIRSHEVRQGASSVTSQCDNADKVFVTFLHPTLPDGYEIEHDGLCTTVFSAPNYVDQVGNKGAFIRIDAAGSQEYIQFEARPHPPMRPMAYVQGGLQNLMMM